MLAEKALLGSFIKANYLIRDTIIKPEQFADERNKKLFQVMHNLLNKNQNVDLITLTTLTNPAEYGGISYLNELISYANPKKYDEYEQLIIESWKERKRKTS